MVMVERVSLSDTCWTRTRSLVEVSGQQMVFTPNWIMNGSIISTDPDCSYNFSIHTQLMVFFAFNACRLID